ncbi:hypothetical protein BC831DRAFT_75809 [Entophlyctis helioformis]|nr:hypothetical protein BC831DRAFT_75809 [Entophlyctis helioformis]
MPPPPPVRSCKAWQIHKRPIQPFSCHNHHRHPRHPRHRRHCRTDSGKSKCKCKSKCTNSKRSKWMQVMSKKWLAGMAYIAELLCSWRLQIQACKDWLTLAMWPHRSLQALQALQTLQTLAVLPWLQTLPTRCIQSLCSTSCSGSSGCRCRCCG